MERFCLGIMKLTFNNLMLKHPGTDEKASLVALTVLSARLLLKCDQVQALVNMTMVGDFSATTLGMLSWGFTSVLVGPLIIQEHLKGTRP